MKVSIIDLTPKMAVELLKKNTQNRTVREHHVNELVKEMLEGRWLENGDPIRTGNGALLDGQHRAHAVIRSGLTIRVVLVDGLSQECMPTIDSGGLKRTAGDNLGMSNEPNASITASAMLIVMRYLRGQLGTKHYHKISNREIVDGVRIHTGLRGSVRPALKCRGLVSPSMMAAMHYLFSMKDSALADKFMEQLTTGNDIPAGDPMGALRNRFIKGRSGRVLMTQSEICALAIKAWNLKRNGKTCSVLRWAPPEEFPSVM